MTVAMPAFIELRLTGPNSLPADFVIEAVLQRLINNDNMGPIQAEKDVTDIIVEECEIAAKITDQNKRGPTPPGWRQCLWNCLGRAATAIPPDHLGHARLASFVGELVKLPSQTVKAWSPDGYLSDFEFWTEDRNNGFASLEKWLRFIYEHFDHMESMTEADAENYVNSQAFLAELMGATIIDTNSMCSLFNFLTLPPSEMQAEGHRRLYEAGIKASAQWISRAGVGLFELCEKRASAVKGSWRWEPEDWKRWKDKFEVAVEATNGHTSEVARRACEMMRKIEEQGVTGNFVGRLGYYVKGMDESDDEEEEDEEDEDEVEVEDGEQEKVGDGEGGDGEGNAEKVGELQEQSSSLR